jgi:hypothetical protein
MKIIASSIIITFLHRLLTISSGFPGEKEGGDECKAKLFTPLNG